MTGKKKGLKLSSIVIGVLVVFWFLVCMIPFFFLIMCTLKEQFELMNNGVFSMPEGLYLQNYIDVFTGGIWKYFFNSVIVMAVSLVLLLALSALAAYPLSRWTFRLNKPIYSLIVACMSVPIHVTLLPIFMMSVRTGMYDSIWALIGPYVAFNLPISVFILTTFMATIPRDLEEAAKIDGANYVQTLKKIIIPLVMTSITTCTFLALTDCFKMYDQNLALTGGAPANQTAMLAMDIFNTYYNRTGFAGVGQAKAVVFTVLVLVSSLIQLRITQSREVE